MRPGQSHHLSAAQQYLALRSNPCCEGSGRLGRGQLTWTWQIAPSPLSRTYTLHVKFKERDVPKVFVDQPDLVKLADGRKIPHVYGESPTQLCLYLPSSGEWRSSMLLANTVIPWAALWLYFFEEWLASDDWKGGGVHPTDAVPSDRENDEKISLSDRPDERGRKVA